MTNVPTATEQEPTDEELPGAQMDDLPPNNYPLHTEWPYKCEIYDAVPEEATEADAEASELVKPL